MKYISKFILLFVLLTMFLGGSLMAQNELTLNDCIELALNNRVSIIAARGAEDLAKANKLAALGAFLPRVSAGYSYGETKQRDIESGPVDGPIFQLPDQDGSSKRLSIGADINWSIATLYEYGSVKSAREKARLDVINSEQDLIYSVKLSYYAYLATVENIEVQNEAVKRSDEQLKLIESRYELGSASLSDVLKQKVQYGNDKLAMLRATDAVITSKASLAYTIGMDPNADLEFSKLYDIRGYDGSLNDALDFGLSHKPSLLASQQNISSAKSSHRASKASYLPSLGAYASYALSDGTSGDTLLFNFSSSTTSLGFNLSWNLFDGFYRERNVVANKIALNNAKAGEADLRNQVIRDIKTAYYGIEQQNQAQLIASDNVTSAEEDLKINQEKYKLGAATILEILDAQVSVKQAQVALIQADFDLNLAIAKLENAMGKM